MKMTNPAFSRLLLLFVALAGLVSVAGATENGANSWPVGAESYSLGIGPGPGETLFYEYTAFLAANEMDDAHGHRLPMDFKLRAFAIAAKLSHNWGVKFLGGELGSYIAVPFVYQQLRVGDANYTNDAKNSNENFSNLNIIPVTILNHKGIVHWAYELEFESAGGGYQKGAALNIGQHNIAFTPGVDIALTPHGGAQNVSARFDYEINDADHATHYRSGNEFFTQFGAQQEIPGHKSSVGITGFFYKQITDDSLHGAPVVTTNADGTQSIGYKGRVLDLGPQVTFPWGKHGALIFKWDHDMLVQNKTRGNSFWFEFGIPFSYLHHPHASTN